jgi:hypothetical protein
LIGKFAEFGFAEIQETNCSSDRNSIIPEERFLN